MPEDVSTPEETVPPIRLENYVPSSLAMVHAMQEVRAQEAISGTPSPPTIADDPITRALAVQNVEPALREIGERIQAMEATITQQGEEIARLNAALRCSNCPDSHPNEYVKDENAVCAVGDCITQGHCDCDMGLVLTGGTGSTLTPPSPEHSEEAA